MKLKLAEHHSYSAHGLEKLQPYLNQEVDFKELFSNPNLPPMVPSYSSEKDELIIEHPYAY